VKSQSRRTLETITHTTCPVPEPETPETNMARPEMTGPEMTDRILKLASIALNVTTGVSTIHCLFSQSLTLLQNKLERFFLASFFFKIV
jgi:hypothetical protein